MLVLSSVAAASFVACDGDETVNPIPNADAAADVGAHDATTAHDASPDGAPEASAPDAGCAIDAGPLDDAAVAAGYALVQALKCQQCHGQTLSGNRNGVPAPGGGTAYPPNLTRDPDTGLGCWPNDVVVNAILNGVDDEGRSLCPPMPHFGARGLDAGAAASIVQFLRSLPPVSNEVDETTCLASDGGSDAADAGSDAGDGGDAADATDDASDAAADSPSDASDDALDAAADG